ncbi:MAG: hypothetical protein ABSB96_08465 [Gaiellaceae bacterium]
MLHWASFPLTDIPGLLMLTLAMLAAWLALTRGRRWVAVWVVAVLALAFTRDTAYIPAAAVCWVAIRQRTKRALALALSGIAAASSAPLLFPAPLRKEMAGAFSGGNVPSDDSWAFIIHRYGRFMRLMLTEDFRDPPSATLTLVLVLFIALLVLPTPARRAIAIGRRALLAGTLTVLTLVLVGWRIPGPDLGLYPKSKLGEDLPYPPSTRLTLLLALAVVLLLTRTPSGSVAATGRKTVLAGSLALFTVVLLGLTPPGYTLYLEPGFVVLLGIALLMLPRRRNDAFFTLLRAGACAALFFLALLPGPTDFRYELVLVPFAAVGFAAALERIPQLAVVGTVPRRAGRSAASLVASIR